MRLVVLVLVLTLQLGDQKVTVEWATAQGISATVASKLVEEEWEITALVKNEQRFIQALCDAGEKKGRANTLWDKLQTNGIYFICALLHCLHFVVSSFTLVPHLCSF